MSSRMNRTASIDHRFAQTVFVVEATDYEQLVFWEKYGGDRTQNARMAEGGPWPTWEQDMSGALVQVGVLDKRPISLLCSWMLLDGHRVLFWEAVSQVVDHAVIERWFKKHCAPRCDKGYRLASCNAMNFGHCLSAIRDLNMARATG